MSEDVPKSPDAGSDDESSTPQAATVDFDRSDGGDVGADGLPVTVQLEPAATPGAARDSGRTAGPAASSLIAAYIGRYRIIRELGKGGFGTVYLAHDDLTDRPVAIKVPRPDRLNSDHAVNAFLAEARHVSRLKHRNIVTLYDCGQEADGRCFLVYEFIDGVSLAQRISDGPLPSTQAALLVAQVADGLHYAHTQGVFHRDIKPGNILLDKHGQPHITDFGLAVREDELSGERGRRSGTCPYISPEQVRGEGHRIDGRTDIYSLGVVLYELLCGRWPFDRKSDDVWDQIVHREPRPPRQINDAIPRELERICLKAMSKSMTSRYPTVTDMAEELRLAQAPQPPVETVSPMAISSERPSRVVPKGLRSFGPEDSDFFLDLLPGPRDRDGLPDSIRFWKTRIESRSGDSTFAIGLIYGPSGCGKSSLVKAGLLPRLASSVLPVYVEATREDTEARLAKGLRKACPTLPADMRLAEMITRLRHGDGLADGRKVLIVLDQFEQWLHLRGHEMETSDLVAALRQADGDYVQILLMVRDDFWMGITRLFEMLEIHLDPERNTRAVDLFDVRHARHVLLLFGQALNCLPAQAVDLNQDQQKFLDQAVHELSEDGRVISVRMSLFAELIKGRPWTLASLVEVGGTAGIGVRFLEETFTGRAAVPEHRAVEKPARALLHALLPEPGTEIKGHMRSRSELASACGLREDSPRLARLIQILDRDLHIITPTEISASEISDLRLESSYYQLTHDYLVPPLRQWLTLERRKSWRGRAELCLEEHAAQMTHWPQSRYLPSLPEYLSITLAVPRSNRKPEQRALMSEAARHYASRWGIGLFGMVLALVAVQQYVSFANRATRLERTKTFVEALLHEAPEGVPYAIRRLDDQDLESLAVPLLDEQFRSAATDFRERLHAACALAHFGAADDEFLTEAIANAPAGECKNIVTALQPVKEAVIGKLLDRSDDVRAAFAERVHYATVLLHLGDPRAVQRLLQLGADPATRTAFVHGFERWHGELTALPELLRRTNDGPFRSGLCAALGLIPSDVIQPSVRKDSEEVLKELYRDAPDAATHSATRWTLWRWNVELPTLVTSELPLGQKHWFVTQHNMTMLEVLPGEYHMGGALNRAAPDVHVTHKLFMSDCEITFRLFCEFVNDPDYDASKKPSDWRVDKGVRDDLPVHSVHWYDALLFCNWLSEKNSLEPCYLRTGKKETLTMRSGQEVVCDEWKWDLDKNGYRLPTEAEWEYACRGGVTTSFAFGDGTNLLSNYAVFFSEQVAPVATKLPNGWGYFDMHGNIMEWCWDRYGDHSPYRVARGGAYISNAEHCRIGVRFRYWPLDRSNSTGLRVVRSASIK